jgi:fido (protein-threonine AMPylation protein)
MEEIIKIKFNSIREIYKKIKYIKPFLKLNGLKISEIFINLAENKIYIYVV